VETTVWQWGPFSIGIYSLAFFAAVLSGLVMTFWEGRRKLLPEQRLTDFLILTVLCAVAGGRLSYIFLYDLHYYMAHPAHIACLQDGGMSFWGGIILSLVVLIIWAGRKRLILERYLDAAAPALPLALALGHIGSTLNGRVMQSGYPWGIVDGGFVYHPDGAYMIFLLILLFMVIRRRRSAPAYEGELFIWFVIGYSAIQLGVDLFRNTEPYIWVFSPGQSVSLAAVILALFYTLAWPKVYTSSTHAGLMKFGRKKRRFPLGQTAAYLLLTGLMVFAYYQVRQPFFLL